MVLGGTAEARAVAARLVARGDAVVSTLEAVDSLVTTAWSHRR